MQEQIGWPPEADRLFWESRILFLYLLFLFAVFLGKSIDLARQLGWFSFTRRVAPLKPGDEDAVADHLAASALTNRSWSNHPQPGLTLRHLQLAEIKFLYRWETCSAVARSLKKLAVLTVLLSALAVLESTKTALTEVSQSRHVSFPTARMAQSFGVASLGWLAAVVLFAEYSFCDGLLARRKSWWNYFCATVRNAPAPPAAGSANS